MRMGWVWEKIHGDWMGMETNYFALSLSSSTDTNLTQDGDNITVRTR